MNIKPNSSVNAAEPCESHARELFQEADRASRRARSRLSRFFARERYSRTSR